MKKYIINNKEFNISVNSYSGDQAEVTVNGITYKVKVEDATSVAIEHVKTPTAAIAAPAQTATLPVVKSAPTSSSGKSINSPLPGVIVKLKVKEGDSVQPGQVVAILEAMKMENEIQAEFAGTITSINVSQGDSVLEGTTIVTIG